MPALPRVKALPKVLLRRVMLAFLVAETSNRTSVTISHRQIAGKFNRSSHRLIGKHLEALIDAGFIEVAMESGGVVPHSYKRALMLSIGNRSPNSTPLLTYPLSPEPASKWLVPKSRIAAQLRRTRNLVVWEYSQDRETPSFTP